MWNLAEYRRRPRVLADHLPWVALVAPGVLLNKDGSLLTTVRFRGPDVSSATPQELMANRARWNNALRRLGAGWCLHLEAARHASGTYPDGAFTSPVARLIDEERRTALAAQPSFESRYYLTFTWLPPADTVQRAAHWLLTQRGAAPAAAAAYRAHLDAFIRQVAQQLNILAGFVVELRHLDDAALLTYLHACISERHVALQAPTTPAYLDALLTDTPVVGGLSPRLGRRWLRVVSVRAYCNATTPCLLDALNELPLEYRWVVRWLPYDRDQAARTLQTRQRQWFARRKSALTLLKEFVTKTESPLTDNDAVNKAADVDAALQELGAEACSFGRLTLTVTTWADDEPTAQRNAQRIQQVLDSVGMVSRTEDFNALEAWLGSLPGHAYADLRQPLVSSLNLCDLLPASSVYSGPDRCAHLEGPVLIHTQTNGATPFRFVLHQGDVGHTLVLGPTGSGKSTLTNLIAAQWRRYAGAQVYVFDKGRSAWAMTLAMQGDFYDLSPDSTALSFQPLGAVDQEPEAIWAHGWLVDILSREGVEVTPIAKNELWAALSALAALPPPQRTLTTLTNLVQNQALRAALRSFTLEGPYGRLLDAERDTLRDSDWQTFEMEELMHTPAALLAVLTYLFHRLERRFAEVAQTAAGSVVRPTLLVLDEAWLFLGQSTFAAKIREWLKTLRKKNVAVLFATQSLADIAESPVAAAILESCPTRVFLPNPAAFEAHARELYRSFGLNERQIANLQSATPKRDYFYQSPAGNRMFQLGLGPIALAFCAAGAAKDQADIERYLNSNDKAGFAADRLRARGLAEVAARLTPLSTE